jgi:predicted nucleic acid-binding protein
MEAGLIGVVLDSSVLVAAERKGLTTPQAIRGIRQTISYVPIVICALTVAELGHGIYRADTPERAQQRRQFLDELKAHIPIYPVTGATAEIIARIGGEQAAKGVNLPPRRSDHRSLCLGTWLRDRNEQRARLHPYSRLGGEADLRGKPGKLAPSAASGTLA